MLRWDDYANLLLADGKDEARRLAHDSGPRQVGVYEDDGLVVYLVHPTGEVEVTHHYDHWGYPAWYPDTEVDHVGGENQGGNSGGVH